MITEMYDRGSGYRRVREGYTSSKVKLAECQNGRVTQHAPHVVRADDRLDMTQKCCPRQTHATSAQSAEVLSYIIAQSALTEPFLEHTGAYLEHFNEWYVKILQRV